jgi:hypothetical protein
VVYKDAEERSSRDDPPGRQTVIQNEDSNDALHQMRFYLI